jgi:hydroxyacylglutathione hydrolase
MKVIIIPNSFDNYAYLIICEKSGEAAVLDPGEFYPVYRELEKHEIRLRSVYCTHHHGDHIGGLGELRDKFDGLTICGSAEDAGRIPGMNRSLTEKSEVCVGEIAGQVLTTPGHTKGSICYSFNGHLFTGDTLFGGGCGRLFEGTPLQMYESLNVKIKKLPMETKIYFGHEYTAQNLKFARFVEPDNMEIETRLKEISSKQSSSQITTPSSMQLECATNPFLRCGEEGVIKKAVEKFQVDPLDLLAVFTAIRRMKDKY